MRIRPPLHSRWTGDRRWLAIVLAGVILLLGTLLELTLTALEPAHAAANQTVAVTDLKQVIDNLRDVIVGLLVGLATLFATIGGVRLMLAGGDPGEAEAGKKSLKNAAYGYGIAILAPVLVQMLKHIVGA